MKTIKIIFICLVVSIFATAQEVPTSNLPEVEVTPPKFNGITQSESQNELHQFIKKHLVLPTSSYKNEEGTAVIQFMVDPAGNVSDFVIVNSISHTIDEELIWVLKKTKNMWAPGKHNGEIVTMEKEIAIKIKNGINSNYAKSKDFEQLAAKHFTKASEKLFFKQNPKKALRSYSNAIRYLPYDRSTLTMMALCQLELGNKEEARVCIDRIKKIKGYEDFQNENLADNVKSLNSYPQFKELLAAN